MIRLQNNYLHRQSQYPKLCIGKCHTPIAQLPEHSACNQEVVGSSPTRSVLFSTS